MVNLMQFDKTVMCYYLNTIKDVIILILFD